MVKHSIIVGIFFSWSVITAHAEPALDQLMGLSLEELMEVTIITGTPQSLAKAPARLVLSPRKKLKKWARGI